MTLKVLLSYVWPQVLVRSSSVYNPDIRLLLVKGRYRLLSSGARASGDWLEDLFQTVFDEYALNVLHPLRRILVLGVGGGTVVQMLHDMFPGSAIDGVDIDPVMMEIGKTYFGLSDIPKLDLHVCDAKDFVEKKSLRYTYGLILIDIFNANQNPDFLLDENFIKNIKRFSATSHTVIINYSHYGQFRKKSASLMSRLQRHFRYVRGLIIQDNIAIYAGSRDMV